MDMQTSVEGGVVAWRRWSMRSLLWSHTSGMLFLQGIPLQQLASPFLLLAGQPRPIWHPQPGLDAVVLADIASAPDGILYPQLFELLAPLARG